MKQDFMQIVTDTVVLKFIIAFNCFVLFDTITGIVKAWTHKNMQSTKLRHGVEKYIIYWVFVLLGIVIDFTIANSVLESHNATNFNIVCKLFCMIVCSIEIKSLQENFKDWNLTIPKWVINLFTKNAKDVGVEKPLQSDSIQYGDDQITIEELQRLLNER